MILAAGTRYEGAPGSVYEVIGPAWDDRRHAYVHARKLFHNFRYPAASLDEAPGDEALNVLIRRPLGSPDDSAFERDVVLTQGRVPFFLEWIDLITTPRDTGNGPWLVLAYPHSNPLDLTADVGFGVRIGLAFEALALLDLLHRSGLAIGPTAPGDFVPRGPDRWYFLGTDRVRPITGSEDTREDLACWARLTDVLLGTGAGGAWPTPDGLPVGLRGRSEWLFERVRLCLDGGPKNGPASVAELERGKAGGRGPVAALRRLLGRAESRP